MKYLLILVALAGCATASHTDADRFAGKAEAQSYPSTPGTKKIGVSRDGNKIYYLYEHDYSGLTPNQLMDLSIDKSRGNKQIRSDMQIVCDDKDARKLMLEGYQFFVAYYFKNPDVTLPFEVTSDTCDIFLNSE